MDRSVDSIGSCSLDVDADSTDFSDTSGELNFLTPISGKDITREFTAGIKERCMLPVINCQAVTSVLDPVTGHISTVLTTTTAANTQQQQPLLGGGDSSPTAATNKKPSYLNLACCVNGYSNLTTYDSKLRQDINKSREVSPSRPIIATLHYNRTDSGTGGHLLTAPTLSYVSMNNTINNNNNNNNYSGSATGLSGGNRMLKMNGASVVNGAGRMRGINGSVMSPPGGGTDMTDNAASLGMFNGNGSFVGSMRTKVISSQSQISSHMRDEGQAQLMKPKKSFIQQRVEKLYGASDVVVLNKQNYSSSERKYLNNIANENNGGTPVKMLMHHHGLAGQHPSSIGNGTTRNGSANVADSLRHVTNGTANGTPFGSVDENNKQINGGEVGEDADVDSLPVLRHLRPEFRAQLQIFSPKKVPKPSPNRTATSAANGNVTHANGNTAEENANQHPVSKPRYAPQSNGNSYTDQFEQVNVSREEQMQDHHHKNLNGTDGTTTHRSVMKSAQFSSHTTHTTTTTTTTINNQRHTEPEQEDTLNSSSRHHSNASARSADPQQTDVVEQQRHEEASQSYRSNSSVSSTVSSSSTVMVEEKMRSLVVVSATSTDDIGVGRMSTSDGSSATTTTNAVPDEQNAMTVVATSVIESQQQNDSVQPSNHSSSNNNVSNGLEHVPAAAKDQELLCALEKSVSGEIVNCDSSKIQQQPAVTVVDTMRTSNGSTTMDSVEHLEAECDNQSSNKTSLIEATTNGTNSSSTSSNNHNNVLDGNHFLRILKTEQKRLGTMADDVEKEINQLKADGTVVLGEDINGYILVAIGKARLLCSQKMKQFEDLCYTNLNQSPDEKFQTTGEDLRGFWDMVMLQVNNVDASFDEIDSFRKNDWRKPIPKSPPPARNGTAPRTTKLVKRPYKTQTTASNGGSTVTDGSNGVEAKKASAALAAAKREAQRKQLMEMKRKQKLANSQQQAAVEIYAPTNEEPAQNGNDNAASVLIASSALVDTS
ncbi:probable WRKY transcription factor protein 1 [Anopheles maculipalpis]|uniref:probable WRKY transcription factor protein 1 n=1 Tax=Anopheles maculipalpis TaxID=1496333 RepID=UPI002158B667|nr:probable WRKY transcription factor protein 1 [Anopheles maculipalpis]